MRARRIECIAECVRLSLVCPVGHICVWDVCLPHSTQLAYMKGKAKDEGLKGFFAISMLSFQPDAGKYVLSRDECSGLAFELSY